MASTSVKRDHNASEVVRLDAAGLSQRQIASRLGISRPMVQRILDSYDPGSSNGSDEEVSEFRKSLLDALDEVWAGNRDSFITRDGVVDPMLYRLEAAESAFNAEYGLTGRNAIKAAKLRRMMAEGCINA
jgi:transposase